MYISKRTNASRSQLISQGDYLQRPYLMPNKYHFPWLNQ